MQMVLPNIVKCVILAIKEEIQAIRAFEIKKYFLGILSACEYDTRLITCRIIQIPETWERGFFIITSRYMQDDENTF